MKNEKIKDIHNDDRQVYGLRQVATELRLGHAMPVGGRIPRLIGGPMTWR